MLQFLFPYLFPYLSFEFRRVGFVSASISLSVLQRVLEFSYHKVESLTNYSKKLSENYLLIDFGDDNSIKAFVRTHLLNCFAKSLSKYRCGYSTTLEATECIYISWQKSFSKFCKDSTKSYDLHPIMSMAFQYNNFKYSLLRKTVL